MYISITDPCVSYVNNVIVNQKSKRKIFFLKKGGGGARVKLDKLGGAHVLKG